MKEAVAYVKVENEMAQTKNVVCQKYMYVLWIRRLETASFGTTACHKFLSLQLLIFSLTDMFQFELAQLSGYILDLPWITPLAAELWSYYRTLLPLTGCITNILGSYISFTRPVASQCI
jgi:hypothetical protein